MGQETAQPRYPLDMYRNFIRDAHAYVSLVVGRRLTPKDAEKLSEEELKRIALLIDERVEDLNKAKK